MACITLISPVAMATTQLERAIRYEASASGQVQSTEWQPLRMNWVVVTGKDGSRKVSMQWAPVED